MGRSLVIDHDVAIRIERKTLPWIPAALHARAITFLATAVAARHPPGAFHDEPLGQQDGQRPRGLVVSQRLADFPLRSHDRDQRAEADHKQPSRDQHNRALRLGYVMAGNEAAC